MCVCVCVCVCVPSSVQFYHLCRLVSPPPQTRYWTVPTRQGPLLLLFYIHTHFPPYRERTFIYVTFKKLFDFLKSHTHVLLFLDLTKFTWMEGFQAGFSSLYCSALSKSNKYLQTAGKGQWDLTYFFLLLSKLSQVREHWFSGGKGKRGPSLPCPWAHTGDGQPHLEKPAAPGVQTLGLGAGTAGSALGDEVVWRTTWGPPWKPQLQGPGAVESQIWLQFLGYLPSNLP